MLKTALYGSESFVREARKRLISVDLITFYAKGLHANAEVIADLKLGHEVNSDDYADDEYSALGGKISQYMDAVIKSTGQRPYQARLSGDFGAFSDFNGWYLEQVIYGKIPFNFALQEYIRISPFIAQRDCSEQR
ncbi:hypothetical protein [Cochlodiniinecator piscidefendens]|uniref:hypothetical protein n=1 Tax=Cochlodiniinecator piscidefendens TaxID=2715756 RepID=UPI0014085A50|nr:hypothetical protein [Cochlodiniinecator piscidefendens]